MSTAARSAGRQAPTDEASARGAEVVAGEEVAVADADPVLFTRSLARALGAAARNPPGVARATTRALTGALRGAGATAARAVGVAADGPADEVRDARFADPAWQENPAFFGLRQAYKVLGDLFIDLVEAGEADALTRRKARLYATLLVDACAPTNFLPTNPAALKRAFETGGHSVVRGLGNFVDDVLHNHGMPRQVDASSFRLGENLAATPGKVVYRNELIELIQFAPRTPTVHATPLLCSPPWINKYYIMDLAPGRSFVEWAIDHGHTVFGISYRNPDASMRDTSMDDYLMKGPRAALDVVSEITGSERVNVAGLCLGGALTAALAAFLAARGEQRLGTLTLMNTLLDYSDPGDLGTFTDEETVAKLERKMAARGYLDARDMAGTFDLLRANDLIFSYVASNWLMGKQPPAFDILAWNADSTRMPAKMHSFYLRAFYLENRLARGELELAGQRLDLAEVTADVFLVGAQNDHIAPWRSAYAATGLFGGEVEFVLSSAGHIAGIVNPPSPKARYWRSDEQPPTPEAWLLGAAQHQASWWECWQEWMAERSGEQVAPPPMGSTEHPVLEDAPGRYVRT